MDATLLSTLANPAHPDRPPLELRGDLLVCTLTGAGYRITDGVPQLLPDLALSPEETAAHLAGAERNG